MILSRVLPKLEKRYLYKRGRGRPFKEKIPEGYNYLTYGLRLALEKVDKISDLKPIILDGFKNVVEMLFGLLPVVMAVGSCALMLAEYTSLFSILGKPYVPF